ncbi:MAG: NYN domain-containing protein [Elusimicrobia bacterium]|nr:NYN domain-containing protein [Elusimicrobiota bacterium]
MSRRETTLLVDGSNAVHALFGPFRAPRDADAWERELVRRVEAWVAGNPPSDAEVVFDGGWRKVSAGGGVRVLFAEGSTADAVILERARALRHYKRKVTVVTWDRDLADASRAEEARVAGPEVLMAASGR